MRKDSFTYKLIATRIPSSLYDRLAEFVEKSPVKITIYKIVKMSVEHFIECPHGLQSVSFPRLKEIAIRAEITKLIRDIKAMRFVIHQEREARQRLAFKPRDKLEEHINLLRERILKLCKEYRELKR
jgi:hypothetical protein